MLMHVLDIVTSSKVDLSNIKQLETNGGQMVIQIPHTGKLWFLMSLVFFALHLRLFIMDPFVVISINHFG